MLPRRVFDVILVLLHIKTLAWACTATQSSIAETTTTAVITTTPNPACVDCNLGDITLTPGSAAAGTSTPTGVISTDANGCLVLTVTCTAAAGGMTFMQFNINQGGPLQPVGTVVTATLNCVNGSWVFEPPGGPNRVITEVNCVNV